MKGEKRKEEERRGEKRREEERRGEKNRREPAMGEYSIHEGLKTLICKLHERMRSNVLVMDY